MCAQWNKSFKAFLKDMGLKPKPELVLDRRDNDKGYSKKNCRWATRKESARNKRLGLRRVRPHTHDITFRRKTRTLYEWAALIGCKPSLLYNRLVVYGWSVKRALTTPVGNGAFRRAA